MHTDKTRSKHRSLRRILYAAFLLFSLFILSCMQQNMRVITTPEVGKVRLCDVSHVYDGDTLSVKCNDKREKLRLYCIDAPEIAQKPWGERSRNYLAASLGKQIYVEYRDTDKYGRTVARIRDGVNDIGARMVLDGFAVVYPEYCPKAERDYYSHEAHAKQQRFEVWSESGLQSKPWEWRHK